MIITQYQSCHSLSCACSVRCQIYLQIVRFCQQVSPPLHAGFPPIARQASPHCTQDFPPLHVRLPSIARLGHPHCTLEAQHITGMENIRICRIFSIVFPSNARRLCASPIVLSPHCTIDFPPLHVGFSSGASIWLSKGKLGWGKFPSIARQIGTEGSA